MTRPQLLELRNRVTNPRLLPLRLAVTNGTRFPALVGKRLSFCDLRRLPGFFHKPTMRAKEQ